MSAAKSNRNSNAQMAQHLVKVLSDTYLLTIKTHGYHWNVTGQMFPQLHTLFENQYNELFAAADLIAERIRALDAFVPGSSEAFRENMSFKEAGNQPPTAMNMVKDLIKTNEQVRDTIAKAREFAGEIEDTASEDIMNGRLEAHEKAIWMLKATAA